MGGQVKYRYGTGKWRLIQSDEEFASALVRRSNVDLKDKWRNLSMDVTGARRSGTGKSASHKRRRKQGKGKLQKSEGESEEDEVAPSSATPRRRQPPRKVTAQKRTYLSDEEAGRAGPLRDSHGSGGCTPRTEGSDAEPHWGMDSDDESDSDDPRPSEAEQITGAAVLILYGNHQTATLTDIIQWIQLHSDLSEGYARVSLVSDTSPSRRKQDALGLEQEDAVDTDCIESILATMVAEERARYVDGNYRPAGALQELADEAVKKALNYAERVLSVMDWVREAEDDLRSRRQETWIKNNVGAFLKEQQGRGNLVPGGAMAQRLDLLQSRAADLKVNEDKAAAENEDAEME